MQKYWNIFFGLLICCAAQPTFARNGYFGIRGGFSDVKETQVAEKYVTKGFGSAYLGTYSDPVRIEAEYTFTGKAKFPYPASEIQLQRGMVNGYIDMPVSRYVRPFVGGGVGATFYSLEEAGKDEKTTGANFAWNVGGGIGIRLTRNVTVDTGYRYVNFGDVGDFSYEAQEMYAGLRFLF